MVGVNSGVDVKTVSGVELAASDPAGLCPFSNNRACAVIVAARSVSEGWELGILQASMAIMRLNDEKNTDFLLNIFLLLELSMRCIIAY
jgi:hypothetical protein